MFACTKTIMQHWNALRSQQTLMYYGVEILAEQLMFTTMINFM